MSAVRLTLIGKPGCHLCDDARQVIDDVRRNLADAGVETQLEELDILQDAALARKHSEHIPVVQIEGRRHATLRVDPGRLTAAIEKSARNPLRALRRP
ncbi:glutaredoxin family protein [Leucobacter japonicus]|uniref:glutaredoxin family protein n=1 Tax=Leucobacter japonicus TaxID=1461259 RepID=UPI0006A78E73|nr:glutaredoxin family protein [Leucobacter japonicus]